MAPRGEAGWNLLPTPLRDKSRNYLLSMVFFNSSSRRGGGKYYRRSRISPPQRHKCRDYAHPICRIILLNQIIVPKGGIPGEALSRDTFGVPARNTPVLTRSTPHPRGAGRSPGAKRLVLSSPPQGKEQAGKTAHAHRAEMYQATAHWHAARV
jgi:hypothetical protein